MKSPKHVIITITGKDKPGIVALVSRTLFSHHCNIEDILMSILQGEFAMILIAQPVSSRYSFPALSRALQKLSSETMLDISVKQKQAATRRSKTAIEKPTYVVSVFGADKPGIVSSITGFFGHNNINIIDMKTLVSVEENYAMLMEIDIPKSISFSDVEKKLNYLGKTLNVDIDIQHAGIFKAMHRI